MKRLLELASLCGVFIVIDSTHQWLGPECRWTWKWLLNWAAIVVALEIYAFCFRNRYVAETFTSMSLEELSRVIRQTAPDRAP
jgi:hypothetical protein